jgi:site-specific DNA recombinase
MNPIKRQRVAIYSRVSTDDQAVDGISIHQQPLIVRAALDRELGAGNFEVVGEFSDAGMSGSLGPSDREVQNGKLVAKKADRPGMSKIFELALRRDIDVVASLNPSRLYRRNDMYVILERVFKENGVGLIFDHDPIDLNSPAGQMMAGVVGAVHSYQRNSNNALIKQMIGRRKDGGSPTGTLPYGWRYPTAAEKESGRLAIVPIPDQLNAVRQVKELYLRGHSEEAVAREMNKCGVKFMPKKADKHGNTRTEWDASRVRILLKNVVHAGYVTDSAGNHIKGLHYGDRAYDFEDYLRIQELMSRKRRRPIGHKSTRPELALAGIPKCGSCGATLSYRHFGGYLHFTCKGLRARGESRHVHVRANVLERAILHEIEMLAQSEEVKREARRRIGQEVRKANQEGLREMATLESRLAKLESMVDEAATLLLEGVLGKDAYQRQTASIESEREQVAARISELSSALSSVARVEDLERRAFQALDSFPTVWRHLETCERTRLLETALESLVVEDRGGYSVARIKLRLLPEVVVPLPRMNAPRNSTTGGVETLTESEMAALWHLADGRSPSQGAAAMGVSRSTFSTLTARAARRVGESHPIKAARKSKIWIGRVAHLLPLYEQPRVRLRNAKRPPFIHTTVRKLAEDGLTAQEISTQIGIDLDRVAKILEGS